MSLARQALALLLSGAGLAAPACAHDTWFARQPATVQGQAVLALGTGTRFPRQDFPISLAHLQRSGCSAEGVQDQGLAWVADQPTALWLRTLRPVPAEGALSCWAQLWPVDIEIDDATVEVYLKEINALPAVRQRWAALRERGVRWKERYVKVARVEFGATAGLVVGGAGTPAVPGLGLDVRLQPGPAPLRAGDTLRAQLLRDGQPLAGLPVELRSDLSPLGLWRQTDAQGRIEVAVPLAAHWVLRGVDLRPSEVQPDAWDSRFFTLAFEVLARR